MTFVLSVIIPVYNRQAAAMRAIESVIAQKMNDVEIVVVDDGSDTPFRITSELSRIPPVQIIRQEKNGGAAAARNLGMRASSGSWIAFLDSDDVWLPNTLKPRFERAVADDSDMIIYVAGFELRKLQSGSSERRIPIASNDPLDFASACWFCPGSTALFRREIFDRLGEQDERLRRFEDNDWFLRLALAGGGIKVDRTIAAQIEFAGKPRADVVAAQADALIEKICAMPLEGSLRDSLHRRLRAWGALERAAVYWYSGRKLRSVANLFLSWVEKPRTSIPIRTFFEHG